MVSQILESRSSLCNWSKEEKGVPLNMWFLCAQHSCANQAWFTETSNLLRQNTYNSLQSSDYLSFKFMMLLIFFILMLLYSLLKAANQCWSKQIIQMLAIKAQIIVTALVGSNYIHKLNQCALETILRYRYYSQVHCIYIAQNSISQCLNGLCSTE